MSAVLLLVLIILAIVLVVPSVSFRSTDRHTLAGHRRRVDALARLTGAGPPPEAPNPTADPTGHVRVVDGDVAPSLPVSARRAHVAVDPWQPAVASRHVPPPLPVADIDLRPRPVEELPPPQIPTPSGRRPHRLVGCLLGGVPAPGSRPPSAPGRRRRRRCTATPSP